MSPCGCKKQKTPEPIRTPNQVTITETKSVEKLTKEQAEIIEKLKKINGLK